MYSPMRCLFTCWNLDNKIAASIILFKRFIRHTINYWLNSVLHKGFEPSCEYINICDWTTTICVIVVTTFILITSSDAPDQNSTVRISKLRKNFREIFLILVVESVVLCCFLLFKL